MNNIVLLAIGKPAVMTVVLVGMTVVFLALIALALIISFFPYIFKTSSKGKKVEESISDTKAVEDNNEELVAVITAAIMASYGSQTNCKLRVTSFRKINDSAPVWNRTARMEYTS